MESPSVLPHDQAIACVIHRKHTTSGSCGEEAFGNGVANQFLHGVAHWAGAKFWVKAFAHEERQHGRVQFQLVTVRREELDLSRQDFSAISNGCS